MTTNETGHRLVAVYVGAMSSLKKTRLELAALLASVVIVACSPGAMPVSQSRTDPSNPQAPEGVAPPAATTAPTPRPSAPPADHSGHSGAQPGSTPASGHGGHGAMPDAGAGK